MILKPQIFNQDIAHDLKRIKEGLPSAFHLVESGLVGKGIAATEIVKSLSYENGPICHYFGTGVGLELQNLDSKIADYEIKTLLHSELKDE